MVDPAKPLRVLVSEGSSTSAREAITILGLSGHHVEVCDPSPWCLARFSRFVRKFHRCPGLRTDPAGFLAFVERLLSGGHFDVLLPTHEQGFLFARVRERLEGRPGWRCRALTPIAPRTARPGSAGCSINWACRSRRQQSSHPQAQLRDAIRFPSVVKTSVGTASRGIWFVRNADDLESALRELSAGDAFADEVLVQDLIAGTTEKAQSVFCRGRLIGFHAYRQVAAGVGGGEAIKQSVSRPPCALVSKRSDGNSTGTARCRSTAIMPEDDGTPLLIDCNPRLVEPMNAYRRVSISSACCFVSR